MKMKSLMKIFYAVKRKVDSQHKIRKVDKPDSDSDSQRYPREKNNIFMGILLYISK